MIGIGIIIAIVTIALTANDASRTYCARCYRGFGVFRGGVCWKCRKELAR